VHVQLPTHEDQQSEGQSADEITKNGWDEILMADLPELDLDSVFDIQAFERDFGLDESG
jgi:hypothetical protein